MNDESSIRHVERRGDCDACPLSELADQGPVHGFGRTPSEMVIVGMAPGPHEVGVSRRPFTGSAGALLRSVLGEFGILGNDIYMTNALLCRPPDDKATPKMLACCNERLREELIEVGAKFILSCGNEAAAALHGHCKANDIKITQNRGLQFDVALDDEHSAWVVQTMHPAYIIRSRQRGNRELFTLDVRTWVQLSHGELKQGEKARGLGKYTTLESVEQVSNFVDMLIENPCMVAFDVETTGVDPMKDKLLCIAFCPEPFSAVAIPWRFGTDKFWSPEEEKMVKVHVARLFRDSACSWCGHNLKFDRHFVRRYFGVDVPRQTFDSMIAAHLIDPGAMHDLNSISEQQLGIVGHARELHEELQALPKGQRSQFAKVKPSTLYEYCCRDTDATRRCYDKFDPVIEERHVSDFFYNVLMPLQELLGEMEWRGVAVDPKMFRSREQALRSALSQIRRRLHALFGVDYNFNFGSNDQLRELLFGRAGKALPFCGGKCLGLRVPVRTGTGKASTDRTALSALEGEHPGISVLLQFRAVGKLLSTYIDGMRKRLVDGRLHSSFNICGTRTGRLSSSNPNLQNIPRGQIIKALFVPDSPDRLFVEADWGQMEYRIWLNYANEQDTFIARLREARERGEVLDIHRLIASAALGIPPEDVTSEQRTSAKKVTFRLLYGGSSQKVAEELGIPVEQAAAIEDELFRWYKKGKIWIERIRNRCLQHEPVYSLFGRRWVFDTGPGQGELRGVGEMPGANQRRATALREAVNYPIQSAASDVNNIALLRVGENLRKASIDAWPVLPVHDSILVDCPRKDLEATIAVIRDSMLAPIPRVKVPLEIELKVSERWGAQILRKIVFSQKV